MRLSTTQLAASTSASTTPFVEVWRTTTFVPHTNPVSRKNCAPDADIEDFTEPSGWFSIGTATFSAGATTRATHEVYAA